MRAQSYYINGVYIEADTYIYDTYDFNTQTNYYTINAQNWEVHDYYIDYYASIIWVKISGNKRDSYTTKTGWVPIY